MESPHAETRGGRRKEDEDIWSRISSSFLLHLPPSCGPEDLLQLDCKRVFAYSFLPSSVCPCQVTRLLLPVNGSWHKPYMNFFLNVPHWDQCVCFHPILSVCENENCEVSLNNRVSWVFTLLCLIPPCTSLMNGICFWMQWPQTGSSQVCWYDHTSVQLLDSKPSCSRRTMIPGIR